MARGANAQLAVDRFLQLAMTAGWTKSDCWKGIAMMLLSCDVWDNGYRRLGTLPRHRGVPDCVVFRERNDFTMMVSGLPNRTVQRALQLSTYLAAQLGVKPTNLCNTIGTYFRFPEIANLQPNNPRGHAFRSIVCAALEQYGNPAIAYEEEVDSHALFPGYALPTRSADAQIDIVARKHGFLVAVISVRWALRHDRIDVVEEALAYRTPAIQVNRNCRLYGVVGEFAPNRLVKVLDNCPPARNAPLDAGVHFCPDLITNGLGVNGTVRNLKSLEWLIDETHNW